MKQLINDPLFKVEVIGKHNEPERIAYTNMHTCYHEGDAWNHISNGIPSSWSPRKFGNIVVNKCLKVGHYGVIESPGIAFSVTGFPHDVMVQARTHRLLEFNVQSSRYTGQRVIDVAKAIVPIEEVFYLRPVGEYTNRQGKRGQLSPGLRQGVLGYIYEGCVQYRRMVEDYGLPEEMARHVIPQGLRQNFTFSGNMRSIMHFLDLRMAADAQPEIQTMCALMKPHLLEWSPSIFEWFFEKHRRHLAP
jgi:thymidylate synthase (FAD)